MQEVLRRKELLQRLHISNTTLYAWIGAGKFPRPIQGESSKVCYWLASDVEKWLAERVVARGEAFRASA
jgi:predicted DNA-binding transcriptional regulator AlpA